MIDHERVKNLASALQSVCVSLAVVLGGIWTALTFGVLGQAQRARAELQKLQLELSRQAVIETEIRAEQFSLLGDSSRYISAIVEIKNVGQRNTVIDFKFPFCARRIRFNESGRQVEDDLFQSLYFGAVLPGVAPEDVIGRSVLRAGAKEQHPYAVRVDGPGLYLLTFFAEVDPGEIEVVRALYPHDSTVSANWTAQRYLVVK